jgi:hypothetical protein
MEASLRLLSEQHECPGDMVLATQVRCNLLVEQTLHCLSVFEGVGDAEAPRAPPASYVKALQSQLQEIKRSLPSELAQNGGWLTDISKAWIPSNMLAATVQLFLHSTELTINEGALNQAPTVSNTTDFQILEGLFSCLKSIDAWLRVFFAMPPLVNIGLSLAMFHQLSHCLISLFRLMKVQDISWDRNVVRKAIDVFAVLDNFANCMEHLPELAGLVNDGPDIDVFSRASEITRALKANWEAEMATGELGTLSEPPQYVREVVPDDLSMNLFDDQWCCSYRALGPVGSGL